MDSDPDYWKQKAMDYKAELDALKTEYEEYQEQSNSLEKEYETELQQNDIKIKDLTSSVSKLKNENDVLRNKLEDQTKNDAKQHLEMSEELCTFKKEVEKLRLYVRQLEQKNDDLERAYRVALTSIDDFEAKYNQALEKNGLLESELDEKEHLKGLVQRLRDESRDLRSELTVKATTPDRKVSDSNKTVPGVLVPPPRPQSRPSPLSIVNDLLRKVGALETKLNTYHRKDEPTKRHKKSGDLIKT